jgi:hypothetical protein
MTTTQVLLAGAVAILALVAVFAGSPLTVWVFGHVDRRTPPAAGQGVLAAGVILRGGQMIGMLERTAVFVTVAAGWPEGMAGVVALKGLGRFAELRGSTEGTAERFIIGSFTSLLFAALLAGLARLAILHF